MSYWCVTFSQRQDYHNELKKNVNKHYVLQHQFFQPAMHSLLRNLCVFSISCTCINCKRHPPSNLIYIVYVCIILFNVMIQHLSVVSLFEVINSLNSSFWCKDRNITGIENCGRPWNPLCLVTSPTPPRFSHRYSPF